MKKVFLFSAKIICSAAIAFAASVIIAGGLQINFWFAVCFALFVANLLDTF